MTRRAKLRHRAGGGQALSRLVKSTFLAGGMTLGYTQAIRRWFLTWGATRDEATRPLPGDDIVSEPRNRSTRAITIHAPAEQVWPWLAQLGQGRGGLYSYDGLENIFGCDIHSANRVMSDFQDIETGDLVRLVPEGFKVDLAFEVAVVDPNRALILRGRGSPRAAFDAGWPWPSWAFVIEPTGSREVRLLVRWRSDFNPTPSGYWWNKYAIEPVHFLMERKMLKGIKERAEYEPVASGSSTLAV